MPDKKTEDPLHSPRMIFDYGNYHRIWPNADTHRNTLYLSVALLYPSSQALCKLLMSKDAGESWNEIADFHSIDKRNTTTGQPFVTREGVLLVPVWNAGFYTNGTQWLAIYKSHDSGLSWRKVYEDAEGTYGKHFFQSQKGNLYLGIGSGGGGSKRRISATPEKAYLLKSEDMGETWSKTLKVDYPTALYSGVALDQEKLIVTAREKRSLFLSENDGKTWKEIHLGKAARNISFIKELGKIVVTSNSAILFSSDGNDWTKLKAPIKGLILRYPTWQGDKLYMSSAGWHSYIVSTNLEKWYICFDVSKHTRSNLGARMAFLNDYTFIGDEANGTLIRLRLQPDSAAPMNTRQKIGGNIKYLESLAKYTLGRLA